MHAKNNPIALVYAVEDFQGNSIYVGQTHNGLGTRFGQHRNSATPFGRFLWSDASLTALLTVRSISGDLDAAERFYIATYKPICNQVQYINTVVEPPCSNEPDAMIIPWFSEWYGPRQRYLARAPEPVISEEDALDRIYNRAYKG